MHIDEFLENISLGELSNLYIGLEGQVELHPQNRKKLINYTNQGLKAICSRFEIKKKELIIRGKENVSLYYLRKAHSMTNGTSVLKYIDDRSCEPFNDDLIKVLEVRNEIGLQFPLNDVNSNESLFTPAWDTLQITHPVEDQAYFVIYQALHPKLTDEAADGSCGCQDFYLPPTLEEALMAFVASKVYAHMNGEANKATSKEFMATFESKCLEVLAQDLSAESSVASNFKANERGYI